MQVRNAVILSLFASLVWAAPAREPLRSQILFLRAFHGSEITVKSGESWLALIQDESGKSELKPVSLRVEAVADEIAGDKGGRKTGKRTSLDGVQGEVIFLLKDAPGVKPGPAETLFIRQVLAPNRPVKLSLPSGGAYEVVLSCSAPVTKDPVERGAGKLILRQGTASQVLATYSVAYVGGEYDSLGSGAHAEILWAGDINGDGRLDLLLDLTTEYYVFKATLFLSVAPERGELVKRTAVLQTVSC